MNIPRPYYETENGQIFNGDCLEVLQSLPDGSVNCCVTSPPYWGLRDYGSDGQLGLEKTPEEYVKNMVAVFQAVKRVLKNDGTLWLNLGDSYVANRGNTAEKPGYDNKAAGGTAGLAIRKNKIGGNGLKEKDLVGIPWRVAFALQADGWYLRQDIIWHKPNPMPESVTDRCTKSHEYIFLLSKNAKYYYDHEAIKEPVAASSVDRLSQPNFENQEGSTRVPGKTNGNMKAVGSAKGRNKRSVWTVTTKPFKAAHFATFPSDLIVPCVLAGCPAGGVVLDPFFGAGTTGVVAYNHGRKFIGIELSETYLKDITVPRIEAETKQLKLF